MSLCGFISVCMIVWYYRQILMIYGGLFVWCVVIFVNMLVICDHFLFISIENIWRTCSILEFNRHSFTQSVKESSYVVSPHDFDGAHYENAWFSSHSSSCDYNLRKWIHENCQGKGVCSVMNLVEDRSVIQLIFWWYPWDFFCHEAWSWGQQVACLILYLPFQMFFVDGVHVEKLSGR